jgi:hypothetical protein
MSKPPPPIFKDRKEALTFIRTTVGCSVAEAKAIMSYADTSTLRDEFAKHAATGSVSAVDLEPSYIAKTAYRIADAMLQVRQSSET